MDQTVEQNIILARDKVLADMPEGLIKTQLLIKLHEALCWLNSQGI